jgi:hypothetical protein
MSQPDHGKDEKHDHQNVDDHREPPMLDDKAKTSDSEEPLASPVLMHGGNKP